MILFGVSQPHCMMLANALNEVFNDEGKSPRYAEPIISENAELNRTLKGWFKKPYQKPYIAVSVDIMSTGVDIPCVRYIGFAALTRSVGKYIQMLGRGTRLDPKTGKFSFQVLDFVGLCKRMNDNGKGPRRRTQKLSPARAAAEEAAGANRKATSSWITPTRNTKFNGSGFTKASAGSRTSPSRKPSASSRRPLRTRITRPSYR